MSDFTPAEQALIDVWDTHTAAEFELPAHGPQCRHRHVRGRQNKLRAHILGSGHGLAAAGVLEEGLPALGADQADRLFNSDAPANTLIRGRS